MLGLCWIFTKKFYKVVLYKYMSMNKVLWFIESPSPYRVAFFNLLGEKVSLRVVANNKYDVGRDKSWSKYKVDSFEFETSNSVFKNIRLLKAYKGQRVFVSNFSTKIGLLTVFYMIIKKIPYIIEIDGGFPGSGKGIKEKIKKVIIKNAGSFFSPSEKADEYLKKYGAKREDIVRYSFTSLCKKDILANTISMAEQNRIKNELGIKEQKNILLVCRFTPRKGVDVFLESIKYIENYREVGIHLVGGDELPQYKEIIDSSKNKNIHYYNFMNHGRVYDFMSIADVFVLPTREDIWGLVINEALAHGAPVITTKACLAGLELVKDGRNGYLVEPDNPRQLAQKINQLIWDDEKISEFRLNAINEIQDYSIEHMVQDHVKYLEKKND